MGFCIFYCYRNSKAKKIFEIWIFLFQVILDVISQFTDSVLMPLFLKEDLNK